jgi:hypothetical protein
VDVSADSPTADLLPRSADGGRRQSRRLIAHPADGFAYLSILPNGELPRSAADFPSVCTGSAQFSHRNKLTLNSLAVSSSLASAYVCVSFRPQLAPASAGAFCYQRLRGAAAGSGGLLPFLLPNCLKRRDTRRHKRKSRPANFSTRRDCFALDGISRYGHKPCKRSPPVSRFGTRRYAVTFCRRRRAANAIM